MGGKVLKNVTNAVTGVGTLNFKKAFSGLRGSFTSVFGEKFGTTLMYAGLGAAAALTGGAALGAAGIVGGAGTGMAGAAAGAAAVGGTGAALGAAAGAPMGYQTASAEIAEEKQLAAQEVANKQATKAVNDAEIMRKQSLMAEQRSMSAQSNASRSVRNRMRGSNTLGNEDETLG